MTWREADEAAGPFAAQSAAPAAPQPAGEPPAAPHGPAVQRSSAARLGTGIAVAMINPVSNQIGAGMGALAFPAIGPVGVVSVRQLIMALVLLPLGRPRFRGLGWSDWWPLICLALVFGGMNFTLYASIERIGLALAITLEFLGPLALAIVGSRRLVDLFCGVLAGVGVYVLVDPSPSTDVLGIGLGLFAAAMWAAYVLLNRRIGQGLPGLQGAAISGLISGLMWVPVAIVWFARHPPPLWAIGFAVLCGVLSSTVPLIVDLFALRRVPTGVFSTLQSMHPVCAALAGLVILHQVLSLQEWLGIAIVVASNVIVTTTSLRQRS